MNIKVKNCIIAGILSIGIFSVGRFSNSTKYNYPSETYFKKGDWVILKPNIKIEELADTGEWITPNGPPKINERVRVLDVSDDGAIRIENYPTYFKNQLKYWSGSGFRKVD